MKKVGLFLLLFGIFLLLAFNKHSKDDYKSYRSVLWADASGYHIYNPIWFIYGNNCESMPDSIEFKTGTGFSFDLQTKRVITKYTSGVAILQAPFFLSAHLIAKAFSLPADGFSPIYHKAIMVAGAFYGLLGLFLSFQFLSNYYSRRIAALTVTIFFLATNLFYYTLDASGFLHIYSFFLISAIALLTTRCYKDLLFKNALFLFCALALVILIRPTNFILILFVLLLNSEKGIKERLNYIRINLKSLIIPSLISLVIFIPQIYYWSQSFNSPIVYSYGSEGFPFLLSPKLLLVWFSTNNGLFTWAPLLLISIAGMGLSIWNKNRNGILVLAIFLITSYIFSSWWNYWFGCAMGARSFVEYYPILMLTFAYTLSKIKNKASWIALFSFFTIYIFINLNIIYYYDGCFYGGEWDWNAYLQLIID